MPQPSIPPNRLPHTIDVIALSGGSLTHRAIRGWGALYSQTVELLKAVVNQLPLNCHIEVTIKVKRSF